MAKAPPDNEIGSLEQPAAHVAELTRIVPVTGIAVHRLKTQGNRSTGTALYSQQPPELRCNVAQFYFNYAAVRLLRQFRGARERVTWLSHCLFCRMIPGIFRIKKQ
jgi:hypothetical protein